ncbi:MAG: RnfH family protein [Aquimonas sp.]|jgi:putative ubiquitin-RnfH superfamily antitoxin RatB of RatAB toxin-antitoxin module
MIENAEADGAGHGTVGADRDEPGAVGLTANVQSLVSLRIEVVYARPDRAWRVQLTVPPGTTALGAFEASGLRTRIDELRDQTPDLGVYSSAVAHDRVLLDGDRLEVYRPLLIDPKEARRKRASQS